MSSNQRKFFGLSYFLFIHFSVFTYFIYIFIYFLFPAVFFIMCFGVIKTNLNLTGNIRPMFGSEILGFGFGSWVFTDVAYLFGNLNGVKGIGSN